MALNIAYSASMTSPFPHVCIKVDNPQVAQNGGYPYSEWEIDNSFITYSFTDDLQHCVLSTATISKSVVNLYPNPATDKVYFDGLSTAVEFNFYTVTGKRVKQATLAPNQAAVDVNSLDAGLYFYTLLTGHNVIKTGKLVKR